MIRFSIFIILMMLVTGCSSNDNETSNNLLPAPAVDNPEELYPLSPNVTYGNGWTNLVIERYIVSGYYNDKTTVDTGAHFTTSRNACGKDTAGPIGLDDWNALAQNVNDAIQKPPLSDASYCLAPTDTDTYLDGTVTVVFEQEGRKTQRILYEAKNGEICSTISDHEISNNLLKIITKVAVAAYKEDCPNGWGS